MDYAYYLLAGAGTEVVEDVTHVSTPSGLDTQIGIAVVIVILLLRELLPFLYNVVKSKNGSAPTSPTSLVDIASKQNVDDMYKSNKKEHEGFQLKTTCVEIVKRIEGTIKDQKADVGDLRQRFGKVEGALIDLKKFVVNGNKE